MLLNLIEFMSRINLEEECLHLSYIYVHILKHEAYVDGVSNILHLEAYLFDEV